MNSLRGGLLRGHGGTVVEYLRAAGIIAVTTAVAVGARSALAIPDVEMLFLLGVMVCALTGQRRAAILAAALAVVAYDFFFVPPPYTLDVADGRYLLTFGMLFAVSVVIGTLTVRLRDERAAALARERRTAALHELARDLGAAQDERAVAIACVRSTAGAIGGAVHLLRAGAAGAPEVLAASPPDAPLGAAERAAAAWAVEHGAPAGRGAEVLGESPALCVPVRAWGEIAAVLVVRPDEGALEPEARALVEAIARQAAVALDRLRLAEDARAASLRAEGERLRSGLLSAVSHDLRTPLASITGAASTLRDEAALPPATRRELVDAICDEAERLERMVSNLLEMTRLDSGAVRPRREWVPAEELVGVALERLGRPLAGRRVTTHLEPGLPLLSVDPILVEQLLLNLLENAAKYTPAGTDVEIRCARDRDGVVLEVADRGPGIPAGDEERVFERFRRGAHPGVRGVGLGLPISRAIAQVHGGRLSAANRPGGGAVFRLTLPTPAGAPPAAGEAPEAPGGTVP